MQENTVNCKGLLEYLNNSPAPFQSTANAVKQLEAAGFTELFETGDFNIKAGGRYFIRRNSSSFLAFIAGSGRSAEHGFRIIAAHTDSPGFRVKPAPEMKADGYLRLNTAPYGGGLYNTWFDRPLSLAGRVFVKGNNPFEPKEILIDLKKPLLIIPSLAIHFNREANSGVKLNPQSDTLAFAGMVNEELERSSIYELVANAAGVITEDILDFDLCLYECDCGKLVGVNEEFISASRLDDLWSVYDGLQALLATDSMPHTSLLFCPDNEEIGSLTAQGANSDYLKDMLKRISTVLDGNSDAHYRSIAASVVISADSAHATHPNYADKTDPTNRPILGMGPVLKYNVNQKYATNGKSAAIFAEVCNSAGVPMQRFINRSDLAGGSTIGSMVAASLGCPVIDMGAPILAMHSIREFGAVADEYYTTECFKAFYDL